MWSFGLVETLVITQQSKAEGMESGVAGVEALSPARMAGTTCVRLHAPALGTWQPAHTTTNGTRQGARTSNHFHYHVPAHVTSWCSAPHSPRVRIPSPVHSIVLCKTVHFSLRRPCNSTVAKKKGPSHTSVSIEHSTPTHPTNGGPLWARPQQMALLAGNVPSPAAEKRIYG